MYPRTATRAARSGVEIGSWFESPLHPGETDLERFGSRRGMCAARRGGERGAVAPRPAPGGSGMKAMPGSGGMP